MQLSLYDWIIVAVYFAIIFYIGFFRSKSADKDGGTKEEFLLAGRKLTLPLFVGTLVATWYGNILGVGEFIYNSGIVAWVCFALPYYISAALFAKFAAGKIRNYNVSTIPEQITSKYGKKAGWLSSVIVLIITIPAAYILILGVLIELFTGWELWISISLGTVLSLAYIYSGGFKADVLTNSAQFVIMYVGFGALAYFTFQHFGSVSGIMPLLPGKHLLFFGGLSWQVVVSWYIISLQTFVDPSFHQRCSAVNEPSIAKKGIYISIFFWAIFDFLTLMTGLYARAHYNINNPMLAYPVLGDDVLPVIWKGLFVISLLATVMSTLDSYSFISAATIGNDILKPLLEKFGRKVKTKILTRAGLIITGVIGIVMAVSLQSAVELIYYTASIAVPGLLMPLIISLSDKYGFSSGKVVIIMIASSFISGFWTAGRFYFSAADFAFAENFHNIEPMIPGIITSVILTVILIDKND